MERILSFVCALSVAATMFIGLATTASAAEKLTAGLKFNGYTYDDVYKEYVAEIEAIVTVPGTLTKVEEGRSGVTGRGVQVVTVTVDYADSEFVGYNTNDYKEFNFLGNKNSTITIATSSEEIVYAWMETNAIVDCYAGSDTFSLGSAKLTLTDPDVATSVKFADAGNTLALTGAIVNEPYAQSAFTFGTYDDEGNFTEGTTLSIPSYNEWANPAPALTVTTLGGWDTGDGLLVIGKVTGTPAEKGVIIDGYTIETGKDKGVGPRFVVTAPASAQGYYGAFIEGIPAGTYSVNTYADDVTGTATEAIKG